MCASHTLYVVTDCSSVTAVSGMKKTAIQTILAENRDYVHLQFQFTVHHCGKIKQKFQTATHGQSTSLCMLVYLCSVPGLHSLIDTEALS